MHNDKIQLRLGLPKGSLQETTGKLFNLAGFRLHMTSRSYYPDIDDPDLQCILIRPQEMARYVEQGIIDCAITGLDWLLETAAQVQELADLKAPWPNYGTVRWVMATKEGSPYNQVTDLQGKRIATEAVGLTHRFLAQHHITANVEFSWGATEVKPPMLADAIVDVTETGSSLRANQLRVIHTVLESTPRFIANHDALKDHWKLAKIKEVLLLLKGAIAAASRVNLAMNVPKEHLAVVAEMLPAISTPTVSPLVDPNWVALSTVVLETQVRTLVPRLHSAGARGIIETPIQKLIE
ncbi:ATP phosphoribosyltransferase [Achromatium sp. WMS2]|nr:ATP phosphoribosyltransferase [Achromatium sp. WMS2]